MFFSDTLADLVARGFILAAVGLAWVVLLIRINGLRSLSKMTNFDFIMTVALGSLLAGAAQATTWEPFGQALSAQGALFFVQWLTARIRKNSDAFEKLSQNTPVLLMRNGEFIEEALKQTRVSKSDVIAKLREANVLDYAQIRAVVLETTGDVSVLHGDSLQDALLKGTQAP
ncbi:DUF421 domain-containing protein [Qipengyuania spongiae]|uniref:DUF421 domain-containing protein n=1 Tax=Qipengyuania spongiae TaxID=2909673 RepID=A0ABY5T5X8_9SPHN|nr:YetF domain-containing protein [Qipengyuania spongiae]UVI40354.1 DUF421 domain-containing protein [Qipengyuania spongiae]